MIISELQSRTDSYRYRDEIQVIMITMNYELSNHELIALNYNVFFANIDYSFMMTHQHTKLTDANKTDRPLQILKSSFFGSHQKYRGSNYNSYNFDIHSYAPIRKNALIRE